MSRALLGLLFEPKNGGSMFFRNSELLDYMTSHPIRQYSSFISLTEGDKHTDIYGETNGSELNYNLSKRRHYYGEASHQMEWNRK
jgi:hypothetical protein